MTDCVFGGTHPWVDKADLRLATKSHARRALRENGFVYLRGEDFTVPAALTEPLETFAEAYEYLPQDRYSETGCRFRRHQRFVLTPTPLTLIPTDISHYAQSVLLNPKDGGTVRVFEPLPATWS